MYVRAAECDHLRIGDALEAGDVTGQGVLGAFEQPPENADLHRRLAKRAIGKDPDLLVRHAPAFPRRRPRLHGLAMARPRPEEFDKKKVVAENRRARFDYAI